MPELPQPQKAAGRKLGGLPAWAWAVAIIGGLLVGFVLLRRAGTAAAPEGSPPAAGPAARPSGGGAAGLLPPELLEALGLQPPTYSGGFADSGSGSGEGGGAPSGSGDTLSYTAVNTTPIPGSEPTPTPWYNTPYTGPDVYPADSPRASIGLAPIVAPGSGSSSVKAQ